MIDLVSNVGFVLLASAIVMALVRIIRGPTLTDRIVALDLLSILGAAAIGVFAYRTGSPFAIELAAVLCATGFVATMAFARYLMRRARR